MPRHITGCRLSLHDQGRACPLTFDKMIILERDQRGWRRRPTWTRARHIRGDARCLAQSHAAQAGVGSGWGRAAPRSSPPAHGERARAHGGCEWGLARRHPPPPAPLHTLISSGGEPRGVGAGGQRRLDDGGRAQLRDGAVEGVHDGAHGDLAASRDRVAHGHGAAELRAGVDLRAGAQ